MEDGQTDISRMLNGRIAASASGTYSDGSNPGVMVRTPDFFNGGGEVVVPATLWHNDIYAPSQMYPTYSTPWCPNDGWDGFYKTDACGGDPVGPWTFATVGAVMAGAMEDMFPEFDSIQHSDWGWGVFYASDANAADKRCVYRENDGGWDCPGGWVDYNSGQFFQTSDHHGAGFYSPGNPWVLGLDNGGGGSGCHFDTNSNAIDQPDAYDGQGNIVQDASCQCNYGYNSDWSKWVVAWTWHTQQKPGFESRNWLDGGGNLAPAWGVDTAACWVNNPRDMIYLQNELYWQKFYWNNQRIPASDWSSGSSEEIRKYWGWNEIPLAKWIVEDVNSWDAIVVKLPADVCATGDWGVKDDPACLSAAAQELLEQDLDQFVQQGKLIPGADAIGTRPGSYILFAREYGTTYGTLGVDWGVNWSREFFCNSWVSPNHKYQVVYANPGADSACFLDYASPPPPVPTTTTTPPPVPTTTAFSPSPVPSPTPPTSSAVCAANDGCVALGLTGNNNCCPTSVGVMLACCSPSVV